MIKGEMLKNPALNQCLAQKEYSINICTQQIE